MSLVYLFRPVKGCFSLYRKYLIPVAMLKTSHITPPHLKIETKTFQTNPKIAPKPFIKLLKQIFIHIAPQSCVTWPTCETKKFSSSAFFHNIINVYSQQGSFSFIFTDLVS